MTSLTHARRAIAGGFVMANHGRRPPMQRLSAGDRLVIYSPTIDYPDGEALRAVTAIGTVTGAEVQPSTVIDGGFCRGAELTEIDPVPLSKVREHLVVALLRYGFFAVKDESADALWAVLTAPPADGPSDVNDTEQPAQTRPARGRSTRAKARPKQPAGADR